MHEQKIYELGIPYKQFDNIPENHKYYNYCVDTVKYSHADDVWNTVKGKPSFYEEILRLSFHSGTHADALCHYALNGRGYNKTDLNGYPNYEMSSETMPLIHGKAVMIDIARYIGVPYLDSSFGIGADLLNKTIESQHSDISNADIILIRTGHIVHFINDDPEKYFGDSPGLNVDGIMWFRDKNLIAVGGDNYCIEQRPIEENDFDNFYPSHRVLIGERGFYIIENLNLEKLSEKNIYEFEFVGAPIRCYGGSASLMNPLAII